MVELVWSSKFKRKYKNWCKRHPDLAESFRNKMKLFVNNPFHPSLRTHSLSGVLKGLGSSRITYEYRLIFKFLDIRRKMLNAFS